MTQPEEVTLEDLLTPANTRMPLPRRVAAPVDTGPTYGIFEDPNLTPLPPEFVLDLMLGMDTDLFGDTVGSSFRRASYLLDLDIEHMQWFYWRPRHITKLTCAQLYCVEAVYWAPGYPDIQYLKDRLERAGAEGTTLQVVTARDRLAYNEGTLESERAAGLQNWVRQAQRAFPKAPLVESLTQAA